MSCQTASRTVVASLQRAGRGVVSCLLPFLVFLAGPAVAQAPQNITVVGVPGFRPTAVLLPHFQFWVAVDTAAGGVVLQDLTINPVTFTGWVRIEGIQPGAREPEHAPFPDSVRFAADGRVTLLVADSAVALSTGGGGTGRSGVGAMLPMAGSR